MSDVNRVIIIGRATRDPEFKSTNGGQSVCRFSLASKRHAYNKQTQESREEVGYFDCIAWGKSGEALQKYLTKGKRICVEGSLRWSSWEGADGKKHSKVQIQVEGFQFLDSNKDGQARGPLEGTGETFGQLPSAAYDPMAGDADIPF